MTPHPTFSDALAPPTRRRGPGRRVGQVAVAALIPVVVAALLTAGLTGGDLHPQPAAAAAAAPAEQQPAAVQPTLDADPAQPVGEGGWLGDLRWERHAGSVWLPESAAAGPARKEGLLAAGFERSEAGVVLAALHITTRVAPNWGPAVFEPTIRDQVTGEHAATFAAVTWQDYQVGRATNGLADGAPLPVPDPAEPVGFLVETFTGDSAVLRLVTGYPNQPGPVSSRLYQFRLELVWADSDWRLVAPPDGAFVSVFSELDTLPADYTPLERDRS